MKRRRDYKENYGNNNQYSNPNNHNYNDNYEGNVYDNYGEYNNNTSYDNQQNFGSNNYSEFENYNNQQYNNNGNYNNMYPNYDNNTHSNFNNNYDYNSNPSEQFYDESEGNFYDDEPEENKPKKNTFLISILSILGLIVLFGGCYFAYTSFIKDSKQTVDLSQYEIEFSPYGDDGEGKPSADIKKIPNVESNDASVKEFLQDPAITYNKNNNLRNGDKVEVSITLSKATAKSKKLELVGEFKRSYTVKGLTQKQKENTVVKEDSKSSSSSSTNTFIENSSVDTTKLSESEVKTWAKTIYIKENNRKSSKSDYSADVWLGNDNLAYVIVKRGDSTVAKYRVNSRGQLEQNTSGSNWNVVSSVYTE